MFWAAAARVKNSAMRKRHDRTGAHGSDRIVEQLHIDDIEMRLARNRRRLERIIEETEAYIARGEVAPPENLPSLMAGPRKHASRRREAR
jgi:hypothetical protein